ncbi:MAG: lipocalin family protein [Alistipes sp.]|nr:lipocalin family protein [Alistipes sp.]
MGNMFKRLLLMAVMAVSMVACTEKDGPYPEKAEPQLEVTRNNISGAWRLESWKGAPLAEGSYIYIDFVRADRTYTMWQNIDSAPARKITGLYNIDIDEELGAVIRGNYDYGNGDWAHRYIVKSLTASEMIWVAKDDAEDVSVYVRCQIPEELLGSEE